MGEPGDLVYVPDWYCTDSARGEGWGSRGDECDHCGRYMFDGTESVTEDAWVEHYTEDHGFRVQPSQEEIAAALNPHPTASAGLAGSEGERTVIDKSCPCGCPSDMHIGEIGCHESGRGHHYDAEDIADAEASARADAIEYVTVPIAELRAALADESTQEALRGDLRGEQGGTGLGDAGDGERLSGAQDDEGDLK